MTDRPVPAESGQSLALARDKSLHRATARARRRSRDAGTTAADGVRLADELDALMGALSARPAGPVAADLPRSAEPSTTEALRRWRARGWRVLLPLVREDLD